VRFLGFRSDSRRLIAASDVFAMPSPEEPFGLVFIEAMAAGIPVLGIASGGAPEVVEDGVTGFLSPVGDVVALARNLERVLDDQRLHDEMGAAGRRRVDALFGADRMARDLAGVYESVVTAAG
jgi:glycosyltransferase involved in cell wall biosynthesis